MTITALWQPIIVTAVVIFIAGWVIWSLMPWHKKEWAKTADEEAVREALRSTEPGMYTLPNAADMNEFNDPAFQKKYLEGPQAFITVVPTGPHMLGGKLLLMFVYNLLVALLCAYFVSRTMTPESDYLSVFRIAGTTAFVAYGTAYLQESIWFGRRWSATGLTFLDAMIYAVLTGGVFGWLVG